MLAPLKTALILLAYVDASLLVVSGIFLAVMFMFFEHPKWMDDIANRLFLPMFVMISLHVTAAVLVYFVSWLLGDA